MRSIAFTLLFAALSLAANIRAQDPIEREDRTRIRETRETMRGLSLDLMAYRQVRGEYPVNLRDLIQLDLREEIPADAWGNAFVYTRDADSNDFRLVSYGSDGQPGGVADAADIVWTSSGEVRELTEKEQADEKRRRERMLHEGRVMVARAQMAALGVVVARYRKVFGSWPEPLDVLRGDDVSWKGLEALLYDPWGNPFGLRILVHDGFALVCYGGDGKSGGRGDDADFVVTETEVRRLAVQRARSGRHMWRMGRDEWMPWHLESLARDIERYREDHGRLPDELSDLMRVGIRMSVPTDRWNNELLYVRNGTETFYVVSLGRNQRAGGVGEDQGHVYPHPGERYERESAALQLKVWEERREEIERREAKRLERERQYALLVEVALAQMENLHEALREYHRERASFPESLAAVAGLLPGAKVPLNPWDHEYRYERTPGGFRLVCDLGGEAATGTIVWTQDGPVR